jgi:hypothetical protein
MSGQRWRCDIFVEETQSMATRLRCAQVLSVFDLRIDNDDADDEGWIWRSLGRKDLFAICDRQKPRPGHRDGGGVEGR